MSKAVQRSLSFPVSAPSRADRKAIDQQRKHLLILGRPRRLRASFPELTEENWKEIDRRIFEGMTPEEAVADFAIHPEVIKVAIPQAKINILDRIRTRLEGSATTPEAIRIATIAFVHKYRHLIDGKPATTREKRKSEPGRCSYIKSPFAPEIVALIGHQETPEAPAYGLCAALGLTRQQVISRAIDEFLQEMR